MSSVHLLFPLLDTPSSLSLSLSLCRSRIFTCFLVGLVGRPFSYGSHEISCKVKWSVIILQLLFLALLLHILEIHFPDHSLETIYLDQGLLSPSSKCQARFSKEVITVWHLRSLQWWRWWWMLKSSGIIMPCWLVKSCYLTLRMKSLCLSENSVTAVHLTQLNVPESSNLQVIIISFHIPSYSLFTNYLIIWWCITWPTESVNK